MFLILSEYSLLISKLGIDSSREIVSGWVLRKFSAMLFTIPWERTPKWRLIFLVAEQIVLQDLLCDRV